MPARGAESRVAATHSYRFRPCHRLRTAAEFECVYRTGQRAGDGLFTVNALANELGFARLGMSVSTRTVGNAVRRNRVRRIIREVFRVRHASLPAVDLVVTSRPGARGAERPAIVTSLERLFDRATREAGGPEGPRA
ncbi:MAG TPA: ribonuclease P protein component [Steroidobacteraceae bacterium]|nr:ribonuclease P protein component [Steroidobacteraceae bacterium]